MREIHEQVKIILSKQCEIVDTKYNEIDFDNDLWFFERQWDKDQEKGFIDWMTNHLQTSREARVAIMNIPSRTKSLCKKTAEAFAFNFGWKYKE